MSLVRRDGRGRVRDRHVGLQVVHDDGDEAESDEGNDQQGRLQGVVERIIQSRIQTHLRSPDYSPVLK